VQVRWILDDAVVERMTDLQALVADEIDAFDGLVDSFAIEDAAPELFDSDAEQLLVLALDLAPARLVLGKIGLFLMLVRLGDADVQVHLRF
jgi:hypothetical protein